MYVCMCLSIYLSIYLFPFATWFHSFNLSLFISIYLSLFIFIFLCSSVHTYLSSYQRLSIYLSIYLSISFYLYQSIFINLSHSKESPRVVVSNVFDHVIDLSEFNLQSRYYVPFRFNTLKKVWTSLSLPKLGFTLNHHRSSALALNNLKTLKYH